MTFWSCSKCYAIRTLHHILGHIKGSCITAKLAVIACNDCYDFIFLTCSRCLPGKIKELATPELIESTVRVAKKVTIMALPLLCRQVSSVARPHKATGGRGEWTENS